MAEDPADNIDLAILDYDMPVMNGCVLADELRPICPQLKIILHSGAVDIPQWEINSVDAFVAKDEGTARLLDQIVQIVHVRKPVIASAAAQFYKNHGRSALRKSRDFVICSSFDSYP
jgi:DNA-binding NarL/FixJ family response regulator